MKKTLLTAVLAMILVMVMGVSAFAGYNQIAYDNASRRVLEITNDSGAVVLRVFARDNNIWNETYGFNPAASDYFRCKGPDYVQITQSSTGRLMIKWVNTSNVICRTYADVNSPTDKVNKNGQYVTETWTGGVLNSITPGVNTTTSSTSYTQIPNMPNTQYYPNGYYQNQYPNYNYDYNYNYNDDDDYSYGVSAERSGSKDNYTWKYKDGNKSYTYKLKDGEIKYGSYEIDDDDIKVMGFIESFVLYVNDDNEVLFVEVGEKDSGEVFLEDFEKMAYKSGSNLIDYIKADGEKYTASKLRKEIKDYDGDDDDDDDDDEEDYPMVKKSSKKYTYYKTKSKKYVYEWDGDTVVFDDDEIEYKDDEIGDVDEIFFTDGGYIYLLTDDGDLYQAKVGKTDAKLVDEDIKKAKISSYMAKYVYDENDKKIDIEDEYE